MLINHDPVMTLTYFKAMSTLVAYVFEWLNCLKMSFEGKHVGNLQMHRILISLKKNGQRASSAPSGTIFYNIQTCLLVYTADLR